MKTSDFMSLNWLDVGKAFLVALLAFLLNWLQETFIPSLDISPETKLLLVTAIGYLIKNFFTKSESQKLVGGRPNDRPQ